jgi:hypothetical protein
MNSRELRRSLNQKNGESEPALPSFSNMDVSLNQLTYSMLRSAKKKLPNDVQVISEGQFLGDSSTAN